MKQHSLSYTLMAQSSSELIENRHKVDLQLDTSMGLDSDSKISSSSSPHASRESECDEERSPVSSSTTNCTMKERKDHARAGDEGVLTNDRLLVASSFDSTLHWPQSRQSTNIKILEATCFSQPDLSPIAFARDSFNGHDICSPDVAGFSVTSDTEKLDVTLQKEKENSLLNKRTPGKLEPTLLLQDSNRECSEDSLDRACKSGASEESEVGSEILYLREGGSSSYCKADRSMALETRNSSVCPAAGGDQHDMGQQFTNENIQLSEEHASQTSSRDGSMIRSDQFDYESIKPGIRHDNKENNFPSETQRGQVHRENETFGSRAASKSRDESLQSPLVSLKNIVRNWSASKNNSQTPGQDLSSAKKRINATSAAFMERIQGAAQRRKLAVTRSRDSIAAKEQKFASTAEATDRGVQQPPMQKAALNAPLMAQNESSNHFKAMKLPEANGTRGRGGQSGVPKVVKRQATTPISPILGPRRAEKPKLSSLRAPKWKKNPVRKLKNAAAAERLCLDRKSNPKPPRRLLSDSEVAKTRIRNHSEKMLQRNEEARNLTVFHARPLPSFYSHSSPSGSSQSSLVGLSVLSRSSAEAASDLSLDNDRIRLPSTPLGNTDPITPQKHLTTAYYPHTHRRAQKRAEYEVQRAVREEENVSQQKEVRRQSMVQLEKELVSIRKSL